MSSERDLEAARAFFAETGVSLSPMTEPIIVPALATLLAQVREEELAATIGLLRVHFDRRDDNDGSTYCAECGERVADGVCGESCIVEHIRARRGGGT